MGYELYYITPTDLIPISDWDDVFELPRKHGENTHVLGMRRDFSFRQRIEDFYSRTMISCPQFETGAQR
jgi:hypothetical protein